jgi:hypothetical protein
MRRKIMLKVIRKADGIEVGCVGEETRLLDSYGEVLYVGDIVRVIHQEDTVYVVVIKENDLAYLDHYQEDWTEGEYGSVIMKTKKFIVEKFYDHSEISEDVLKNVLDKKEKEGRKERFLNVMKATRVCCLNDGCNECPFRKSDLCEYILDKDGFSLDEDLCFEKLMQYIETSEE